MAGGSLDLLTGWNFDYCSNREVALKMVEDQQPKQLIGSPMCTMYQVMNGLGYTVG